MAATNNNYACDYSMSFRKVDANDTELLSKFQCEYPAISDFIQNQSIESKDTVSYVFIDDANDRIMAFCAIRCTGISVNATDRRKRVFVTSIPAIEINYFAVDEEYRSLKLDENSNRYETLSRAFMLYMIEYIKTIASNYVGATHICLYAVTKAVNFYKRCGFEPFEEYMNHDELPFLRNCVPMFYVIDND
jgi:GNAT superfamily N-acetyltransferase